MLPQINTINLLISAKEENLYELLIMQLNKDFQLANINEFFKIEITPELLYEKLGKVLYVLITKKYDDYLNFVYRIDLSEKELRKIVDTDLALVVKQLTFLILKREYQKVWLKKNY